MVLTVSWLYHACIKHVHGKKDGNGAKKSVPFAISIIWWLYNFCWPINIGIIAGKSHSAIFAKYYHNYFTKFIGEKWKSWRKSSSFSDPWQKSRMLRGGTGYFSYFQYPCKCQFLYAEIMASLALILSLLGTYIMLEFRQDMTIHCFILTLNFKYKCLTIWALTSITIHCHCLE